MRSRSLVLLLIGCTIAAACGEDDGGSSATQGSTVEPFVELVVERPAPESPDVDTLVAGINAVGYDLFVYSASQSDGDVVLSPVSIGIAFGMADAGASGTTAAAIEDLFGYPVDGEARWAAFNAVEQQVTDVGERWSAWRTGSSPTAGSQRSTATTRRWPAGFGAAIEPLPLQADSGGSTARINDWVSEETEGLIPDLLPPGFVNSTSVMVLVNALYLEADWVRPFGKYPTEDHLFTRIDGSTVSAPLMHELELDGPAIVGDDYAATEVPYEGGELSMLVIVPDEGMYADVEGRLASGLVDEIDERSVSGPVELWLPRFESDKNLDLRDAIESGLGVRGHLRRCGLRRDRTRDHARVGRSCRRHRRRRERDCGRRRDGPWVRGERPPGARRRRPGRQAVPLRHPAYANRGRCCSSAASSIRRPDPVRSLGAQRPRHGHPSVDSLEDEGKPTHNSMAATTSER